MEWVDLVVKLRQRCGKGYSRRLRKRGFVPAVLYGQNKENLLLELEKKQISKLLQKTMTCIINLNIQTNTNSSLKEVAILKDIQISPIKQDILHVDFMRIDLEKPIKTKLSLVLEGQAKGVKEGGRLIKQASFLEVAALPDKIPDNIKINIENIGLGEVLRVGDIKKELEAKGLDILEDDDTVILTIAASRVVEEKAEELEEKIKEPEVIKKGKKEEEE